MAPDDFFTNRDDNTAPDSPTDLHVRGKAKGPLHRIIFAAVLMALCAAVWHFTDGDLKTAAMVMAAVFVTGVSLYIRLRSMKMRRQKISPARMVVSIVMAALIIGGAFYFYVYGIDRMLEP